MDNVGMIITLIILLIASILFVTGKVRSDLVAISALSLLVIFDILNTQEALAGFASNIVIMMIGLFVIGGAIFQTGLANKASSYLLKFSGHSETRMMFIVMIGATIIGLFISNTGTVAVMLPIVISMAAAGKMNVRKMLMPLAFAASLAGTLTLIGTAPNIVVSETLEKAGYSPLAFFSFTPSGIVALIAGMMLIVLFTKLFIKDEKVSSKKATKHRTIAELATAYRITDQLARLQVGEQSPMLNRSLKELSISSLYRVNIIEVRRRQSKKNPFFKTVNLELAGPETMVNPYDILYVSGEVEDIDAFAKHQQLIVLSDKVAEIDRKVEISDITTHEIGIAEVLIPSNSKHINQLIKHSGFRENYNVNVLGVQRKGQLLLEELKEVRIRSGDALLVQGQWNSIARLSREYQDVVVVGQPQELAASVPLSHKGPLTLIIMLLMIVGLVSNIVPAVICIIVAAILLVATGCLANMEAAYKTVNWESVVLIGAMIPMSTAIEKTGAATLFSETLVSTFGQYGPIALLASIYLATSFMTLFISNTACAVLFAPIALSAAVGLGVSPIPFMFAVSLGSSLCFAVPFSTPPNALVMSAGKYKFMDYVKVGMPVQVLLGIIMVLVLPLIYSF